MNMQDIYETEDWTDEDWRARLQPMDKRELLHLWCMTSNYNPACYTEASRNAKALETFRHARHCMFGELLERMGE